MTVDLGNLAHWRFNDMSTMTRWVSHPLNDENVMLPEPTPGDLGLSGRDNLRDGAHEEGHHQGGGGSPGCRDIFDEVTHLHHGQGQRQVVPEYDPGHHGVAPPGGDGLQRPRTPARRVLCHQGQRK